jgi:thioredoxin 1/putative thioredoxin
MATLDVTEKTFEAEVLRSDIPVLLEFGAAWCGPCKMVAPELEALSVELQGKAKVVKVDIDRNPLLAQQMGVQSVPTFVVFAQGRPVTGKVGALRKPQLLEMLEPLLPRAAGALKPQEVAQLAQAGRISLVDTREAPVFNRSRIAGSTNIPFDEIGSRLAELHMLAAPPVLYCRGGEKTKELAQRLAQGGTPVAFLEGGVLAWEAAGFELERPD